MSPIAWGRSRLQVGVTALVVAAGSGRRMGAETPKQFLPLLGEPVLLHTLRLFENEQAVDDVVLVAPEAWLEHCQGLIETAAIGKVSRVVTGGITRTESVRNGLKCVTGRPRIVAVHDAVRPLLPPERLSAILAAAAEFPALAMAIPALDTVKQVGEMTRPWRDGALPEVVATPMRDHLWLAQTPQVFWSDVITAAYEQAVVGTEQTTDCAALVEALGMPVHLFPGSPQNLKLTTPLDFLIAESILAGSLDQPTPDGRGSMGPLHLA